MMSMKASDPASAVMALRNRSRFAPASGCAAGIGVAAGVLPLRIQGAHQSYGFKGETQMGHGTAIAANLSW